MTRIDKIPDITPAEVEALHTRNIDNTSALWREVGQDFNHSIDDLAEKAGIDKSRLVDLLKAQALVEFAHKGSWAGRHWLELAILVLFLLILSLVFYAS